MKSLFTLAALGILAAAGAAAANFDRQDHAIDQHGQQVQDARGDCIYTKWQSNQGGCRTAIGRDARIVFFDFNKSTIRASERSKLDALADTIRAAADIESVTIVGHADRIGASDYNVRLSQKRATAVKRYLAARGVKVRNVQMHAVGEAESVTACDANLPRRELINCLAEDRRVEVALNYRK